MPIQKTSGSGRKSRTTSSASRKKLYRKSRYYQQQRKRMIIFSVVGIFLLLGIILSVRTCVSRKTAQVSSQDVTADSQSNNSSSIADNAEPDDSQTDPTVQEPVSITLSIVGDCTLGTDEAFDYDSGFTAYYDNYGKDYFFQNVKSIFQADDLTVANFEGTLTDSDTREDKLFAFKAPAQYAQILTSGSVEAVNTANNHSHDYGDQSYSDTLTALDSAGITHFGYDDTAVIDVKNVKVGLIGIYELNDHLDCAQQLKDNISKVKQNGAQLIIVIFHWGNESETVPDTNQMTLGRLAVDEGADLVCGHHPHVLQGIETYNGKNIVYSLGNFCFGGNSSPSDMDTMIFQQTFTITSDGVQNDNVTNIIPCSISSASGDGYNNYQPTPASGDEASRILQKIQERSDQIPNIQSAISIPGTASTTSSDSSENTDSSEEDSSYTEESEDISGEDSSYDEDSYGEDSYDDSSYDNSSYDDSSYDDSDCYDNDEYTEE